MTRLSDCFKLNVTTGQHVSCANSTRHYWLWINVSHESFESPCWIHIKNRLHRCLACSTEGQSCAARDFGVKSHRIAHNSADTLCPLLQEINHQISLISNFNPADRICTPSFTPIGLLGLSVSHIWIWYDGEHLSTAKLMKITLLCWLQLQIKFSKRHNNIWAQGDPICLSGMSIVNLNPCTLWMPAASL